jgi:hypothetical protein
VPLTRDYITQAEQVAQEPVRNRARVD